MDKIIDKINNDIEYINNLSIPQIKKLVIYSSEKYYNTDSPVISDEIYDILIEILNKNGIYINTIGASNKTNKIKLDYWLGSLNKIKVNTNELDIWKKKYTSPYMISDKLDGVSALLIYNNGIHMYTRGNGSYGFNISHLLKYLKNIIPFEDVNNYCNLNNIKGNKNMIAFRGELVMKKSIFEKNWNNFSNSRNAVSGLINSKNINIKLCKDVDLVLYEIVDPIFNIVEQYNIIKNLKFNYVYNKINKLDITHMLLSEYLENRKLNSIYQIDGIVITSCISYERNITSNPSYSIAYKNLVNEPSVIATVKRVEWNISKDGYLIPTIIINEVSINEICIKRTSGFNAKYIVDNNIGTGSKIEIVRSGDVIPYIKTILTPSKSGKPDLPIDKKWKWNDTKVDIILINNEDTDYLIKNIYYFFSVLNTKGLGLKTIQKFYLAGFNTINKIILITKDEILKIDTFKEKSALNILAAIKKTISNISIIDLMVASNKLGHGIGPERIKQVFLNYPNIIEDYNKNSKDLLINNLKELNGWDTKTASLFINKLLDFIKFYNSIKQYVNIKIDIIENNKKLNININSVVFSGTRDKNLQNRLENLNIKVSDNITKSTDYLIIDNKLDLNNPTNKIKKAIKFNIKIKTKDEFIEILNNF